MRHPSLADTPQSHSGESFSRMMLTMILMIMMMMKDDDDADDGDSDDDNDDLTQPNHTRGIYFLV